MIRVSTIAAAALLISGSGVRLQGDPPELQSAGGTEISTGTAIMSFTLW